MKRVALLLLALALISRWCLSGATPEAKTIATRAVDTHASDECPHCRALAGQGWASDGERLTADGAAAAPAAGSVDDNQLMKQLTEAGTAIIDGGKFVEGELLIKQLENAKCELKLPAADPQAPPPTDVYSHAKDGVVIVCGLFKCMRCDQWHASPASGFVISADGVIVTSHHVINEKEKKTFVIMTSAGKVYPVSRVLAGNKANDIAVLQVDGAEGLKPLPLGPAPTIGTQVAVLSHPASHFYSYSTGIVSRYTKVRNAGELVDALQITADYARGSSGGPVLDAHGRVVGIVRSTESIYYSQENGNQKNLQMVFKLCVPADSLVRLVKEEAK